MAGPDSDAHREGLFETFDGDSSSQNPWNCNQTGNFTPYSALVHAFSVPKIPPPSGYHEVRYDDPVAAYVDEGNCVPCDTCYKAHSSSRRCPYFNRLPRGAAFDTNRYEIRCACGHVFNEDRWSCPFGSRSWPVLKDKYCSICKIWKQHSSYECPMDKVEAAIYKLIRDKDLSKVPIPYRPIAESSSGT